MNGNPSLTWLIFHTGMLNYKIKDQTKLRLDQYLSALKIAPSRSQLSRWIKEGYVFLNG
ncbi:MAG TPA: hypothetical protein DDW49_05590, partial [Deltaproteobacteria bacterium]|nr:hypothetical protein [Deltaproteobacteria bacterium]